METHEQGTTLVTAILAIVGLVVVVQLWLLAAALDALLQGATGALVPSAAGSFVLLALNGALLRHVSAFDARLRHRKPHD